ncbi:MAG: alpha/beta hydrolase [Lactobacillus sp.]|nr:alpha/beta hydrolase [Lactobacillus sp.]
MNWIGIVAVIAAILLLVFVSACAYAGHFFINAFLVKDSTWYHDHGHQMMNPDNFDRPKNIYTETEDRQNEESHKFWDENAAGDLQLKLDGETLVAREFKGQPGDHRWVLCVHGYRSTGKRDMSYPAMKFARAGYNVVVPDLRAHGKSTGEVIGMGWLEKEDVKAWANKIVELDPAAKIILFGGSMGAASVMMASGDPLPKQVKMLIADCGYSSVYNECRYLLKSALHLPTGPILFFC